MVQSEHKSDQFNHLSFQYNIQMHLKVLQRFGFKQKSQKTHKNYEMMY